MLWPARGSRGRHMDPCVRPPGPRPGTTSVASVGSPPTVASTSTTRRASSGEPPPVIREAKLIRNVPGLPVGGQARWDKGLVDLELTISSRGVVEDALRSPRYAPDMFEKSAVAAVRKVEIRSALRRWVALRTRGSAPGSSGRASKAPPSLSPTQWVSSSATMFGQCCGAWPYPSASIRSFVTYSGHSLRLSAARDTPCDLPNRNDQSCVTAAFLLVDVALPNKPFTSRRITAGTRGD